jgi:hypothetical protein
LNEGKTYIKFFFNLAYWTVFNYFIFWRLNQKLIEKVKEKKEQKSNYPHSPLSKNPFQINHRLWISIAHLNSDLF